MKRVILLTAHFPPSNLVGVHRARIWANLLPEFGWMPTVVTAHWNYYEEKPDWDLMQLVNEDVEVIRTRAVPARPIKIIGNMALRAFWWTRRAVRELLEHRPFDFMHIIVPDHFSTLIGPMFKSTHGLPFGVDFMDPWVVDASDGKPAFTKAWFSRRLGRVCERRVIPQASLITGVSALSFQGAMERYSQRREDLVTEVIPMASPPDELEAVGLGHVPRIRLIDDRDGCFTLIYMGASPPSFQPVLERFLEGVARFVQNVTARRSLRVLFVGTGRSPDDPAGHRIKPLIERLALQGVVSEYPCRIGYLDALWHLRRASGVLVLGSGDRHYSPSKVYQCLQTRKPLLALLHRESEACHLLRAAHATLLAFDESGLPTSGSIADALATLVASEDARSDGEGSVSGPDHARDGARRLALALDRASTTASPTSRLGVSP